MSKKGTSTLTKIVWGMNLGLFAIELMFDFVKGDPILSAILGINQKSDRG